MRCALVLGLSVLVGLGGCAGEPEKASRAKPQGSPANAQDQPEPLVPEPKPEPSPPPAPAGEPQPSSPAPSPEPSTSSSTASPPSSAGFRVVEQSGYRGVVAAGGAFELSDELLEKLEHGLAESIRDRADISHDPIEYTREYRAYEVKGVRHVSVRLHCSVDSKWREGLPRVRGGGDCYLRATYDVAVDSVRDLRPNSRR